MRNIILSVFVLISFLGQAQQKAQVIEGVIIHTGTIPSKFERPNGQTVWGGYDKLPDSIHYVDGWRPVVVPAYNPQLQRLTNPHWDLHCDCVTYDVVAANLPTLEERKQQLRADLYDTMMEVSTLITACNNLYGDQKPAELDTLITTVRGLRSVANTEIDSLSTPEIAAQYVIRGPQVEALLEQLKSYIQ